MLFTILTPWFLPSYGETPFFQFSGRGEKLCKRAKLWWLFKYLLLHCDISRRQKHLMQYDVKKNIVLCASEIPFSRLLTVTGTLSSVTPSFPPHPPPPPPRHRSLHKHTRSRHLPVLFLCFQDLSLISLRRPDVVTHHGEFVVWSDKRTIQFMVVLRHALVSFAVYNFLTNISSPQSGLPWN